MEGVRLKNANLLSAISISGRLVTRRGNFLKKCKGLTIIMRFLDSWLHGASAGYT
jgi:hypothetical protein